LRRGEVGKSSQRGRRMGQRGRGQPDREEAMFTIITLTSIIIPLGHQHSFRDILFDSSPNKGELETLIFEDMTIPFFPNLPQNKTREKLPNPV
jgi:hypothetical protein